MGKTKDLGHLAHIVEYDASNNITLPANLTVTGTITGYATTSSLSSYVPTSRTITINGTSFDLSANREWNITSMIYPAAGIALSTGSAWGSSITNNSANWNTAYGWGNHASAGYVPQARTITINGTAYDLSANRSWTVTATETDTLATVMARGASTASGITFTAPGGTVLLKHAVSEVDAWIFQENSANWGLYWKNNPSGNHTFGGYTTVGAELFGMSAANASGNGVTTSNFVGATSAIAQWMISNYTGYIWSASTIYAQTSMIVGGNTVYHSGNIPTWNQNTTGSAGSVAWTGVSAGIRENYDLQFRPADNSSSYSGFSFASPGNSQNGGYFLIRGGADSDVYTQNGITLVADLGWLTLAQRTTANKGVRIMTGSPGSTTRFEVTTAGATNVYGNFTVNTGGTGTWGPFVVTSTSQWGDGATQYVTIGAGGAAGIMINNPHIVWNASEVAAGIKFGRSGGISTGSYYVIGTGASNNFFINKDGAIASPILNINSSGNASFSGTLSASNLSGTNTGDQTNISGNAATATNVAWSGVTSKPSYIMYYQGFTLNADSMDTNATGFTYSVGAPYTGPIARFSAGGSYDLQINANYGNGTNIAYRTRNGDAGAWNSWYALISTANIGSQSVSYATSAGSATSASSATALNSSNYIQRASTADSNLNTDFRNTPAGTYRYNGDDANLANSPGGTWWFYENMRHSNASNYWGTQIAWGWEDNANRLATRNVTGNSFGGWVYYLNSSNYNQYSPTLTGGNASGIWNINIYGNAVTATTASNLSDFNKVNPSFGAVYADNWFRVYDDCGLYQQTYGGHFRRSTSASYGTWEIFGYNKGGYAGINLIDPSGYWSNLMFESGSGGIYQQNGQSWLLYFFYGNDCLGLSGSETYDWVRACTNGKHRITNDSWCDATSWAYTFSNISDGRLKENIVTVDSALDKVLQLRGVYYNWIIDTENKKHIGLIAQETAAVCPEVVNYHDETDTYSVNYSELSGLFVESTKELNQKLIDANARIELLEAKINQLLNA
jgi:hypothetical protein